ncbi:cupin domain-containing protein [Nocardia sp. CDC160]|uniref:cupin domain-containing protein n=1 Tax=Nocardia sp. CDC160 TaxID=3112166 RepID=UPI002DB8D6D5|nr:cupin domain-containing protein [Nocardia sp. CDC160]MEC3917623.1 cupin domain-containing protein [Nocardia sp. CDC160]
MQFEPIDLSSHGVRLCPDGSVVAAQHPMGAAAPGWTVAAFRAATTADVHGDHWEMHPDAEELVAVLSGGLRMYLRPETAGGQQDSVTVPAGNAFVVPRGRWHRIELDEPSHLMAITVRHHTRLEKRTDQHVGA